MPAPGGAPEGLVSISFAGGEAGSSAAAAVCFVSTVSSGSAAGASGSSWVLTPLTGTE